MPGVTAQPDWRARRWEETHRRIYAEAMRLFAELGFEAVSVIQIAAAAGVSVPTFYAHFPHKEDIVLPVPTAEDFAPFLGLEPCDLPLAERMTRLAPYWLAQFTGAAREELLNRWRVVATTPSLRLKAAEYERVTARAVVEAFERAGTVLTPADRVAATAVLAAFTAAFLAWADSEGAVSLEQAAQEAFQALHQL